MTQITKATIFSLLLHFTALFAFEFQMTSTQVLLSPAPINIVLQPPIQQLQPELANAHVGAQPSFTEEQVIPIPDSYMFSMVPVEDSEQKPPQTTIEPVKEQSVAPQPIIKPEKPQPKPKPRQKKLPEQSILAANTEKPEQVPIKNEDVIVNKAVVNEDTAATSSATMVEEKDDGQTKYAEAAQGDSNNQIKADSSSDNRSLISSATSQFAIDQMAAYKNALAEQLRSFKRYPKLARVRQWEGTSEFKLFLNEVTKEPDMKLIQSSGYVLLDDQALTMLRSAIKKTPLPDSLKKMNFILKIPIQFRLEEANS